MTPAPPGKCRPRHPSARMIYGVGTTADPGGLPMPLEEVVTEHFLARYRALLDAEDCAFDELEHAYEDGDRDHFSMDLDAWQRAVARRLTYLQQAGVELNQAQPAFQAPRWPR